LLRRQQEERKNDSAQKASSGIALTDAGVTKDDPSRERRRDGSPRGGGPGPGDQDLVLTGAGGEAIALPGDPDAAPTTRPIVFETRPGFGQGCKLDGTFVGQAELIATQTDGDLPTVTFRRDGTFHTHNMATAEIDMEPGSTGVAPLDRGSGRYKLAVNTLELTYTDGLTRRKGNRRVYTVVPVEGPERTPTAITIQGKVFKLDPAR
jgi:hypothetical protein